MNEKKHLKSEDAIIVESRNQKESLSNTDSSDAGEKEIQPAAVTSQESAEKDRDRFADGCVIWFSVIIGGAIFVPCAVHFVKKAFESGLYYNLWIAAYWIIAFILYALFIRWYIKKRCSQIKESESDVDLFTKLMIGIMGSEVLIRKKKDDPEKH